jgi:hypothetical protein
VRKAPNISKKAQMKLGMSLWSQILFQSAEKRMLADISSGLMPFY